MSDDRKQLPADREVMDFLAELDAEFGKKKRGRPSKEPEHKELNRRFHLLNPGAPQFAKQQLEQMKFENYYDWEMHRLAEREQQVDKLQQAGEPTLQWLPEAQISYVVHQTCACCKETTTFVGNEYIRFRGRRRKYRDIEGREHETYPTMLKRVSEVDGNLLAYGLPNGDPLPDFIEEMNETVRRCYGCIQLERAALDVWVRATQPDPQGELDIQLGDPDEPAV